MGRIAPAKRQSRAWFANTSIAWFAFLLNVNVRFVFAGR